MVEMPVSIYTKDAQYNVSALNVSAGGLALEGVRDPSCLPESIEVNFTLPETAKTFNVNAQVIWANVQGEAGIRFLDLPPERQDCLRRWLKQKQIDEGWTLPEE